ncbi:MAG: DNA repair protein RecN [Muribaculaceae bacterium]|nr:DNA repair protein RecN [Muribaculaceae bacterium]
MLTRLSIRNYALINSLEIRLAEGLTIITGETGAGKSIMLGALGLLLGDRADSAVVSDSSTKMSVEAEFSMLSPQVSELVAALDPDWSDSDSIIVRRELNANGRSRAFLNDSPVKISDLSEITRRLLDIHSQHSNRLLSSPDHQLSVLDVIADNTSLLEDYREEYKNYVSLRRRIKEVKEENERNRTNRAMLEFQAEELSRLNPKPGELVDVERRFDILSDAGEISSSLGNAAELLSDGDNAALTAVSSALDLVSRVDMSLFEHSLPTDDEDSLENFTIDERLRQVYIELKDISETLSGYASEVDDDPGELARVAARMQALYAARRKFHIGEETDLSDFRDEVKDKLSKLHGESDILAELESLAKDSARCLKEKGERLSKIRGEAALKLESLLLEAARPLGMPNLDFKVQINRGRFSRSGADEVSFLTSFNKNMPLQPMAKVASGGEMSRLMLSLKAILSEKMNMPTVIFDEIDTGVSGEIADKMGSMMQNMGMNSQIITITHLPQVASKGSRHFKVFKQDQTDRTVSGMTELSADQRVLEIAGMLSGETLSDAAIQAAKSLLNIL